MIAQALMFVMLAGSPTATVDDFSWLAGHWRGEGLGGQCEEIWSQPMAGTMVGSFRLVKDGEVQFYELMVLTRDGDDFVLKVKHFTADFVGWEEKDDSVRFVLTSVTPNRAQFKGLSMARDGDRLEVRVRIRYSNEDVRDEPFVFERYRIPE